MHGMDFASPDFPRLWTDFPDALERAELRADLTEGQARALEDFGRDGWCRVSLVGEWPSAPRIREEVDELWRRRPVDLAYFLVDAPRSMADADPRRHRRPPCRLLDPHSHSSALRDVYLNEEIFGWARILLDEKPVAFRSVLSEFGSRRIPRRDAAHLAVRPLLSAWASLEDVDPQAGPLVIYPGSHRWPFHEFEEGRILIREGEDDLPAYRSMVRQARRAGVEPLALTPKRGTVIFRHPSLWHGAQPARRPELRRLGLEVHFSSDAVKTCDGAYLKKVRGRFWRSEERLFWKETTTRLEGPGTQGFQSPLHGLSPRGASLFEKVKALFGGQERILADDPETARSSRKREFTP